MSTLGFVCNKCCQQFPLDMGQNTLPPALVGDCRHLFCIDCVIRMTVETVYEGKPLIIRCPICTNR